MNARRVLPLLIGASLSGCAAAPLYTPATYTPPEVAPQFLATAIPMAIPTTVPDSAEIDRCIHVMSAATAWVMTTTRAINECLAGPRTSVACRTLPLWMSKRESIMGTWESGHECAVLIDRAGIKPPALAVKASEDFVAATNRYAKRFGS